MQQLSHQPGRVRRGRLVFRPCDLRRRWPLHADATVAVRATPLGVALANPTLALAATTSSLTSSSIAIAITAIAPTAIETAITVAATALATPAIAVVTSTVTVTATTVAIAAAARPVAATTCAITPAILSLSKNVYPSTKIQRQRDRHKKGSGDMKIIENV